MDLREMSPVRKAWTVPKSRHPITVYVYYRVKNRTNFRVMQKVNLIEKETTK